MGPTQATLERGRGHYARQEWGAAHDALAGAGAALDIERRATCSYMLGREDEYLALLADAHRAHLDEGDASSAVRCGFWIGAQHAQNGDIAQAGGWLGRARRIYEQHGGEEVALGYLMLPEVFERMGGGDLAGAAAVAGEAAAIAERGGDRELFALSAHMQGHMLIAAGRAAEGLPLLDEAMLPAASGELSPIATGIVYCGVILACRDAYEVRRAREWTAVLSDWCERQPDLVAFTGRCRIHRAEILQLGGSWAEALDEAREARERALRGGNEVAAGEACFRQGELHRLRGEWAAAERAYREANRNGREPQPGLALLRLAQGDVEAALGLVRRTLAETEAPGARLALLPAAIEILVAAGELEEASAAAEELGGLIDADECPALAAALLHARAGIALAGDDPASALPLVRRAAGIWQELGAPYELAQARELAGFACRAAGDEEGAALELDAARGTYAELRARPDLKRLDRPEGGGPDHGLTARELEVLRLVAAGETNRAIAGRLVLSVRTVDRHVSNIYVKLGVSSRASATAYAHEHDLA